MSPVPTTKPGEKRAPLVVAIVVDQLAAWVLGERLSELPKTGGFARLAAEGTRVRAMRYAHAVTDTAPGHASLYTGRTPAVTGIFGNEIFDAKRSRISILRDEATELVGPRGKLGKPGSSPRVLRSASVTEAFLAHDPTARVLSLSWKDRGAILPAGHVERSARANVMWFDVSEDSWVTSTAFADELPAFAKAEIAVRPASSFRASPWQLLEPGWVSSHARTADDAPGEGNLDGLGTTFPHAIPTPKAMRATPASDAMILSMALAGLEAEPRDAKVLLELSLSANDYVGHVFGPDSWEAWDELRRLDGALARFFAELDARYGAEGWSAVLSADHGTVHMPEALAKGSCPHTADDAYGRPCSGRRILPDDLGAKLRAAEPSVVGICDPWVFFEPAVRADRARLAAAEKKVIALLAKEPGVRLALPSSKLREECKMHANGAPTADPYRSLVCASWSEGAGDVYVLASQGAFFDPLQVVGTGVSHGSPYLYDRTVPLLFRRGGGTERGRMVDDTLGFEAFRAVLEGLTGLGPVDGWTSARVVSPSDRAK